MLVHTAALSLLTAVFYSTIWMCPNIFHQTMLMDI